MTNCQQIKYERGLPFCHMQQFFYKNLQNAGSAVTQTVSILQLCTKYGFVMMKDMQLYFTVALRTCFIYYL